MAQREAKFSPPKSAENAIWCAFWTKKIGQNAKKRCEETKAKFDALGGAGYPPFQVQAGPDPPPSGPGRGPPSSTPNALISNPGRGRGRLVQWSACPPPLPDREVSTLHEKKYSFRNDLLSTGNPPCSPSRGTHWCLGCQKKKIPPQGVGSTWTPKTRKKRKARDFT